MLGSWKRYCWKSCKSSTWMIDGQMEGFTSNIGTRMFERYAFQEFFEVGMACYYP
jgi:hypothetical protein